MVYVCSGEDSEKLEWFEIINIAGEKLTNQELRNAVYAGSWLSDAKRYFSRTGCAAYGIGSSYVQGSPIRQDYLETAIKWISAGRIEDYMGTTSERRERRTVVDALPSCDRLVRSNFHRPDTYFVYEECGLGDSIRQPSGRISCS